MIKVYRKLFLLKASTSTLDYLILLIINYRQMFIIIFKIYFIFSFDRQVGNFVLD